MAAKTKDPVTRTPLNRIIREQNANAGRTTYVQLTTLPRV
jgi:hypothetical protein